MHNGLAARKFEVECHVKAVKRRARECQRLDLATCAASIKGAGLKERTASLGRKSPIDVWPIQVARSVPGNHS